MDKRTLMGPYAGWPFHERRSGRDRRLQPTPFFNRYLLLGKRRAGRRQGERDGIYVDRFSRKDLMLGVSILVLNLLDAVLTLRYLDHGGSEANPIARFVLEEGGELAFLFSKVFVIALCLLFLTMHKTFRRVRPALYVLLGFYSALLLYHLYLQGQLLLTPTVPT